jgi:hypothetical protein
MNERIKQLADDAGFLMWDGEEHAPVDAVVDWSCSYDYELEKFAELIVRECLGCCEQVISDPVPESVDTWLNGGTQCMTEIKQHFGVEE